MDAELHKKIRILAATKEVSMTELINIVLEREVEAAKK